MRIEFYLDPNVERWRWRVVGGSNSIVARSAKTYAKRTGAIASIHGMLRGFGVSPRAVNIIEVVK